MLTFCRNATETGTELVIQSRVQLRVDSQYSSSNKCSRCGSFAPSYSSVDLGGADTVRTTSVSGLQTSRKVASETLNDSLAIEGDVTFLDASTDSPSGNRTSRYRRLFRVW